MRTIHVKSSYIVTTVLLWRIKPVQRSAQSIYIKVDDWLSVDSFSIFLLYVTFKILLPLAESLRGPPKLPQSGLGY